MSLHAVWVPGSAAIPDRPEFLDKVSGDPPGYGIGWTDVVGFRREVLGRFRIRARKFVTFTFPISTPVLVHGSRARLTRAFVFWRTSPPPGRLSAALTRVTVVDASAQFLSIPLNLSGDFSRSISLGQNAWDLPGSPQVFFGVAVTATFTADPDIDCEIHFTAAGIDCDIPG